MKKVFFRIFYFHIVLVLFFLFYPLPISTHAQSEEKDILRPPYLLDEQGRITIYHGITVSRSAKNAEDFLPWQKKEDFARLNEWGINLVRYLIFWEAIEPTSGTYNNKYMQDTLVRLKWLEELGIDVLLCIHQDLYHRKFGGSGFPDWAVHDGGYSFTPVSPPYKNYFTKPVMSCFDYFWRSEVLKNSYVDMVKYLLSNVDKLPHLIGLEIFDEPWPHIGAGFEQTILTDFYKRIEKMKISNNFKTALYFQPMLIASVVIPTALQFQPSTFAVYAVRYYDPFYENETSTYGRTNKWVMNTTISQRVRESRRWGIPMLITDFGVRLNLMQAVNFLDDWFSLMNLYHLGWIYDSYDRDTDNPYGILDSEGNTKTMLSKLIQTYPQKIAGKNPTWYTKGNIFKLTYEPDGNVAPTVIFIPRSDVAKKILVNTKHYPYDPLKDCRFEYKASPNEKTVNIVIQW